MTIRAVQVSAEVLSAKKVGAHHHLALVAPGVAESFRPGSLVSVAVGGPLSGRLTRRTLPIARARATGAYGGTIEIVIDGGEPGERWLTNVPVGSRLDVIGPLGRPFALPKSPVPCLLVGEGAAAAPLVALAERLRERFCEVHVLLGAATGPAVYGALEARRIAGSVVVVTQDGSLGLEGRVRDHVAQCGQRCRADVVYAAGSNDLLAHVAEVAEQRGAWSQTALYAPMPCGTGLCQTCLVPVVAADGIARLARLCTEGPVFRGDLVDWLAVTTGTSV